MSTDPGTVPVPRSAVLHLHRWNDRAVVGVAIAAFASGFGQFGVVAALDVDPPGAGHPGLGARDGDGAGGRQQRAAGGRRPGPHQGDGFAVETCELEIRRRIGIVHEADGGLIFLLCSCKERKEAKK